MTLKQIKAELESMESIRGIVEVYEELAAKKMQEIRGQVLTSRDFLEDLLEIFVKVKGVYRGGLLPRNGRKVAVWIAANAGLYGEVIEKTWEKFTRYVEESKAEAVVVGKMGREIMQERNPGILFNYFDMADEKVDWQEVAVMLRYIVQFEKITVFHGKYKSVLVQEVGMTTVSGDQIMALGEAQKGGKYLFEPTEREIARVFEGEILGSLVEQTLHESRLAKFASRMLALDAAMNNMDKSVSRINQQRKKAEHLSDGRKQLNRYAGMRLWAG